MNYYKVYMKNKSKRIAVRINRTGMIVVKYIKVGIYWKIPAFLMSYYNESEFQGRKVWV